MVIISRIAIPDSAFDTLNYHIYLQERVFSNNTGYNFFPARWINTFSLPLADRIHFLFRNILGYRLGIFANILVMVIIYYQIKIILNHFIDNKNYISLLACIILITEQLMSNMMNYYVDLMSIPLFLEILIIIYYNKKSNTFTNIVVLFMAGVLVSLKISNAFFIIPLAIIYIFKYKKDIDIKSLLIGIPVFTFPFLIYLINNYIQTGNPVFPFYNALFHSKYLPDNNWIETFYGPKRNIERVFWPIYILFYPRRTFDADYYYGRVSFGYFISLILFIIICIKRIIKKEKLNDFDKLIILFILLCLIWSTNMMGYIRYALVLEVLSGIILSIIIFKTFTNKKNTSLVIGFLSVYAMAHTMFFTMGDMLNGTREYSWRIPMSIYNLSTNDKKNFRQLFAKKKNYEKKIKEIDCIGIIDYNSGYAALLSKTKKIINLNEGYASEYGKKEFEKRINKCKNIYTVSTTKTLERTEKYLMMSKYKRKSNEIKFKTDFLNADNDIILFEIEKE